MAEVMQGMTRREVKRLLGKPANKINESQFMKGYSTAIRIGGGRSRRSEAWLYVDSPQPGQQTFIMFERGRVTEVQIRR